MSETNDAHVTRWRHGSRGIAVLSADCSPNTLAAVALVHSIQMMLAEIVDPGYLRENEKSMTNSLSDVASSFSSDSLFFFFLIIAFRINWFNSTQTWTLGLAGGDV